MIRSHDEIQIALLSSYATTPTRATPDSVGLDLYAAHEVIIRPGVTETVRTDLQIKLPPGTYGRIAPRSGLSATRSLVINGGVIDGDYRGNITVIVINLARESHLVRIGDRIAQLICEKASCPVIVIREPVDIATPRGAGGFGSSGN